MNDALSADPEELRNFEERHPTFRDGVTRLQSTLEVAFLRTFTPRPDAPSAVQSVVFFLGHQAADDFFDILLLAVYGHGVGAMKLLRPLYERVVTALYLIKHPDEVEDFNHYADVDAWRLVKHARQAGVNLNTFMTETEIAGIRKAYDNVKPRFTKPGQKRERGSWAQKDLAARANAVGLGKFYGGAAFWPTLLLHTTRTALESRLDASTGGLAFKHGPQRDRADRAIRWAHALIVQLLHASDQFFEWNLDMAPLLRDLDDCWRNVDAS
jgi:Family of unknown function (DUF5677)